MPRAIAIASIWVALGVSACAHTAVDQAPVAAAQKGLRSPDVIFVPTPPEVVDAMLTVAKVGPGDVL
jgi:hypothetical protein